MKAPKQQVKQSRRESGMVLRFLVQGRNVSGDPGDDLLDYLAPAKNRGYRRFNKR